MENIQNEDFDFKIVRKSIFKAFFRHSTLYGNLVYKFKGRICVYIYIHTYGGLMEYTSQKVAAYGQFVLVKS